MCLQTSSWTSFSFTKPSVMGIVNVTPDSFFDGGSYTTKDAIAKRIDSLVAEGSDCIDIGAYSSRPGAKDISEKEEFQRLKPALDVIRQRCPNMPISIDTFRSTVIEAVLDYFGPIMVNDISGGILDPRCIALAGKYNLPYVCMHMQGTPQTMQNNPHYTDVVEDLLCFFSNKVKECTERGINTLIIDPGFGFGKTVAQNYQLLNNLERFKQFEKPILIGISRKSMIQKVLECTADDALNGTTILNTIAILKGASILRVHDVAEAKEVIRIVSTLEQV